jgi:hypothetical protein
MIEAELQGEGKLSDLEIRVSKNLLFVQLRLNFEN